MVFWVFVAPEFIAVVSFVWKFALISTHTGPVMLIVTHYFLTNAGLKIKDWWYSFLVTAVYCCVNYAFTKLLGAPVYPMITWEDIPLTAFFCLMGWAFGQTCVTFTIMVHFRLVKSKETPRSEIQIR